MQNCYQAERCQLCQTLRQHCLMRLCRVIAFDVEAVGDQLQNFGGICESARPQTRKGIKQIGDWFCQQMGDARGKVINGLKPANLHAL